MSGRVILGLSGGVDSAVAALELRQAGYEVEGVFLDFGFGGEEKARQAAGQLGIPLTVRSTRAGLEREVCAPFCQAYAQGMTPNPCIRCNETVKFPALFQRARERDALVATGHYARIVDGRLYRAPSPKDQSYLLYRLPPAWQARLLFPLGQMGDKGQVRALAAQGLPVPGAISVVGYDGTSSSAYSVPRLTTIRQDTAQLAERGVQTLLRGIHYAQPPIHEAVPFTLLQRESVRVLGPAP